MVAQCKDLRHPHCCKTRTTRGGSRLAQGRPLGFLGAWLEAGRQAHVATQQEHLKIFDDAPPSLAVRSEARATLQAMRLVLCRDPHHQ